MIYLGHFSYESRIDVETRQLEHWHGYFTCIAEAESVAQVLEVFDLLLRRLARSSSVFCDVKEVFLDSCIEIKSVHRKGRLSFFKEIRGMSQGSISASLIGAESDRNITAYRFDVGAVGEVQTTQPFIVFPD